MSPSCRSSSQIAMSDVVSTMISSSVCSRAQAFMCVDKMAEKNKVMLSGDILYRI